MNLRELQLIANHVAHFLKLGTVPTIEIKSVKIGWARPKTNKITIPLWASYMKCKTQAFQGNQILR
jgi:hypothetical protein